MAQKNNIRSIRFSDDLAELIDRQTGDTFTQKFENLITRCVWELPRKEEEIQRIEKQIQIKKEEMEELYKSVRTLRRTKETIDANLARLEMVITQELRSWEIDM